MRATHTIAFSAVFAILVGAGAAGRSSAVTTLRDGVVRDERVTQVIFSGGSGDVTALVDAAVKGVDIRRRVEYLNRAPSIEDTIQFAGGIVTLSTSCGEQCTASYEVRVPVPGVKVTGRSDSGDLRLQGVSDVDIEAGSGDVTVDGATGTVQVRSGSGDVDLTDIAGPATVNAESGDVDLTDIAGLATVNAGSGDVDLTGIPGPATVNAGSGDVEGRDLRGTRTGIEVSSGDITLELPGTGDVTALTRSGDIDVSVPDHTCRVVASADGGDLSLGVIGASGNAHILELRTNDGDISVRPAL